MGELKEDAADQTVREEVNLPVATSSATFPPVLASEIAVAQSYRRRAKSANTLRAYASDWRQFEAWCDDRGLEPVPARAEAVATYLAVLAQAGKADSTIGATSPRSGGSTVRRAMSRRPRAMRTW